MQLYPAIIMTLHASEYIVFHSDFTTLFDLQYKKFSA